MGETTTTEIGLLSWGLSLCRAALVSVRDLVAGQPDLQAAAATEDEPSFEPEELDEPEEDADEGAEVGPNSATTGPAVVTEGSGPVTMPPSGGGDAATTVVTEPTSPPVGGTTTVAAEPIVAQAPTPKQRITAVWASIKAAEIKDRYWPTATGAEKAELKTFQAAFQKLSAERTEEGAAAMEAKLRELTACLRTIDSAEIAFTYEIKQIGLKWEDLLILFSSTIDRAPDTLQGGFRDRADTATDAYYAGISDARNVFKKAVMADVVKELQSVVDALLVYDPGAVAAKDAKLFKTFDPEDPSTWDRQALRVVGKAASYIGAGDADAARIEDASVGDENTKNRIVTGVAMHRHATGGTSGISFAYNHLGGRKVEPVIFDYAVKRQDNDYVWETHGRCGGPAGFGSVVINRSVPPPYI